MHIDENKKFDKRNIEKNLKSGIITEKEYEMFLVKLPDVSDKLFDHEGAVAELEEAGPGKEDEGSQKKKILKKKSKGKVK